MVIECPECGAKNQITQPTQSGKRYRCGKCGEVITFLETIDVPSETTSVPIIDRTSDVAKERTSSQGRSAAIPKESIALFQRRLSQLGYYCKMCRE